MIIANQFYKELLQSQRGNSLQESYAREWYGWKHGAFFVFC